MPEAARTVDGGGGGSRLSVEGKAAAANKDPGEEFTFRTMFHRFKTEKTRCDKSIKFRSVVDKFSVVDQLL